MTLSTPTAHPLLTSLPRLRHLYTDLTLTCQGQHFPVHRLVLGAHSPDVLGKSFSGWSSDAQSSTLEIRDAQPDALKAMLDYFYTGAYSVPESVQSPLYFHLEVYQLADRYQCRILLDEGLNRFATACQSEAWDASDFVKVARHLEISEVGNKQALRGVVLQTMRARLETLLLHQEFAELLGECRTLNLALLKSFGEEGAGIVFSKRAMKRRQKEERGVEGCGIEARGQKSRWSSPEAGVSRR